MLRRFLCSLFISILVGSGLVRVAGAEAVFVDRNGDDANPGTAEQPLRSIASLRHRLWEPGDAIYFRGGQTFAGALKLAGSGSDERPIIVGSFGKGRATIDSMGETLFLGYNQGGFRFQDLELKSSRSGEDAAGIVFYADSEAGTRYSAITITDCELRGFSAGAIKIGTSQPSNPGWSRIRVEHCRCSHSGEGMAVYGSDSATPTNYAIGSLEVTQSEFYDNRGTGLSICGVASGLVEFCSFHDNQRVGGCWTWAARKVLIQHCISYRNRRGSGNDGFGFDLDGGSIGCTIQDCLSYQNDTAGFAIFDYPNSAVTADNTIRYCISENDVRSDKEGASFEINSWANTPIRNSFIYNCAAYLTSHGGRSICAGFMGIGQQAPYGWQSGSINGCGFWNNLIYLAGNGWDLVHMYCQTGARIPSEISYLGNDYASFKNRRPRILVGRTLFEDLRDWRNATGQERLMLSRGLVDCGLTADPQYTQMGEFRRVTDPTLLAGSLYWRPVSSSPCLGSGLDLSKLFHIDTGGVDFYGNPLRESGGTIGIAGRTSALR